MTEEKLNFVWDTPNGVAAFALNENLIDKIKESGCYSLNLALESGNQYVLDNVIKKPLKLDRARQLVKYAQSIGLNVKIYLIMGMPGETKEQIWDSFHMAKELGIYTPFISIATPYPGSELYDICRQNKYIPDDFSLDDLFIRSFSISTEDWTGKELKETLRQGQRFLFWAGLSRPPFKSLKIILRAFLAEPKSFFKRAFNFALNRELK